MLLANKMYGVEHKLSYGQGVSLQTASSFDKKPQDTVVSTSRSDFMKQPAQPTHFVIAVPPIHIPDYTAHNQQSPPISHFTTNSLPSRIPSQNKDSATLSSSNSTKYMFSMTDTSASANHMNTTMGNVMREGDVRCTTPEEMNNEKSRSSDINGKTEKIAQVVTPTSSTNNIAGIETTNMGTAHTNHGAPLVVLSPLQQQPQQHQQQSLDQHQQPHQVTQIFPVSTVQTVQGQSPIFLPSHTFSQLASFQSNHQVNNNVPIIPNGGFDGMKVQNLEIQKVVDQVVDREYTNSMSNRMNKSIANAPSVSTTITSSTSPIRLNKFVRRLHDMLQSERNSGIVEWCKGLLILHSTDTFAKKILPKYFNTRNFKTFRRQLNYYGFVHVRSFSTTGSTTTALWVNQDLAKHGTDSISSVLLLKRVEPCEAAKTAEGRRIRKEEAAHTVEDIGITTRALQAEHMHEYCHIPNQDLETNRTRLNSQTSSCNNTTPSPPPIATNKDTSGLPPIPSIVHCVVPMEKCLVSANYPNNAMSSSSRENNYKIREFSPATATTNDAACLLLMLSKSPSQ